ncbi:hypothetical protein BRADI_2g33375v3 [Brachypodium distachyon]|uniref:Uncharacterized protein n=1 Tax=Brachypodium distachyon TaxID=15368 RepID=A0A2K2DBM4_BRADI|nr:hypothetical protein BRADI_2g33375v3 [Brachypodium distachyon]
MEKASRYRSTVWKVSNKRPGPCWYMTRSSHAEDNALNAHLDPHHAPAAKRRWFLG